MKQQELEKLVEGFLNDSLSSSEWDRLNTELESSRESRDIFRDSIELHGGLAEFHSLRDSIIPITDFAEDLPRQRTERSLWPLAATLTFAVIAIGVLGLFVWKLSLTEVGIAEIVSSDSQPKGTLKKGSFSIDSGFAEIEMSSGARFAMEHGTTVRLISGNRIRLVDGTIGVIVPKRARGFTVETDQGNIVDLGTRFGVSVDSQKQLAKAELFSGEIEIHSDGEITTFRGKNVITLTDSEPPRRVDGSVEPQNFPMPKTTEVIPIVKGDFELGENYQIADSSEVRLGVWGGNYAKIVSESQGISPYAGEGMLKLVSSGPDEMASGRRFCDVLQWVDFRPYVLEGATISARAYINRVAGDEKTDTQFELKLSAHRALGGEKLIEWNTSRLADSDPETWEIIQCSGQLLPDTQYMVLRIGASENQLNNTEPGEIEFDGHYIDHIEMKLILPARPAVR
ncbi:MAG: FecR domain-containing protein [Verrucomicrobiota bacterium]